MSLGEFLRAKRFKRGFSQEELSKLTGIHRITISRFENNYQVPHLFDLMTLKKYLRISWEELDEIDFEERVQWASIL